MSSNIYSDAPMVKDASLRDYGSLPAWLNESVADPELPPLPTPQTVLQHAINRLVGDPEFPDELLRPFRTAEARWVKDEPAAEASQPAPASLDAEELDVWPDACAKCGSLELWQSVIGEWRCTLCDPPTASRGFLRRAERIKQRWERLENNAQAAMKT